MSEQDMMKKTYIAGLLLCSECENQLNVDVYSKEFGFFKVYPCTHCAAQQASGVDSVTNSEKIEERH